MSVQLSSFIQLRTWIWLLNTDSGIFFDSLLLTLEKTALLTLLHLKLWELKEPTFLNKINKMNQKQNSKTLGKILRLSCEREIMGWYLDAKSENGMKVYSDAEKDVPQLSLTSRC